MEFREGFSASIGVSRSTAWHIKLVLFYFTSEMKALHMRDLQQGPGKKTSS